MGHAVAGKTAVKCACVWYLVRDSVFVSGALLQNRF